MASRGDNKVFNASNPTINAYTDLTLTNDQDLGLFEVGDVVQEKFYTNGLNVTGQTSGSLTIENFITIYNEFSSAGTGVSVDTTGDYIEFRVPSAGTLILVGGRQQNTDVSITATGDFNGPDQSFTWTSGASSHTFEFSAAGLVRFTVNNNTPGIYFLSQTCTFEGQHSV